MRLSWVRPVILGACCLSLGGCVVAAMGAAAGGGYVLGQDRGVDGTFTDTSIKAQINAQWVHDKPELLNEVFLNIFNGRVLLTGHVPTQDLHDLAGAGAWKADGVKDVINDIQIGQPKGSSLNDNWIQTKLRSSLTFDADIRSMNYSLQTVDGVVYILGMAQDTTERDKVLNYARNIPDVVRVVNYIQIRPATDDAQAAPAAPPPSRTAPPPPRSTAPNPAAIQSEPLE